MPRASALLAGMAIGLLACKAQAPQPASTDARRAVSLPVPAQDAVRAEMNTMLISLNRILAALPRGDTAAIRAAAAASGIATAADPTLEHLLPEQFLTWGTATHRGFDDLGASVASGAPSDTTVVRLAAITQGCVTCHATYRLAPK